jgi:acetoin utilization deacetylase AcuC-like enzyme
MSMRAARARNSRRCQTTNNQQVPTVFSPRYCCSAATTNSTEKQLAVVKAARAEGLIALRTVPFDEEAAWASVTAVHDPPYVDAVRTGQPIGLAESQGFRWSPRFANSVARIWAGHLAACRLALTERTVLHPVSGAHHAGRDRGSGFCTFNFLVGGALEMLRSGLSRVAIVDLDAHPGDGTYRLTRGREGVTLFDIAGGRWVDVVNTPMVEYHVARNADEYEAAMQHVEAFLDRVRPDLVMYQAGMDPYERDSVGGIDGVDEAFLRRRDSQVISAVRSRDIPLVVNIAGGYGEDAVRLHVTTVRVMASSLA